MSKKKSASVHYEIVSYGATHVVRKVTVKGKRSYRVDIAIAFTRADAEAFVRKLTD